MNTTELFLFNVTPNTREVTWEFIFTQFCTAMDEKILLACLLLLTVFTLRMIVLPRAKIGILTEKRITDILPDNFKKLIAHGFYYLDSLLETLGLGSALFLVYLMYKQGFFNTGVWVWIYILGGFVVLAGLGEIVYYFRNRKRIKSPDNTEKAYNKQEEYKKIELGGKNGK